MKTAFKIIVITPEKFIKNEIGSLRKLFSAGLTVLHVRKPEASKEELRKYLSQIPGTYYKNVVIHSHFDLIREFNLKGAHLNERSRTSAKTINNLKRNKIKIISASFHSVEEIKKSHRKYQYIFLSPVFNSISKKKYKAGFDLDTFGTFLKNNKNQVVALGGITDKNIISVKNYGLAGAATIGYVWEGIDPVVNYKKLVSKIK